MLNIKKIFYVVEQIDWSIYWDGNYISNNLKKIYNLPIKILPVSKRNIAKIKDQIIHFGSRNTYLPEIYNIVDSSNAVILTWFHGTDSDTVYINLIPKILNRIDFVHTSCNISRDNLIRWGFDKEKIVVIPIGVDTSIFKIPSSEEKERIRQKLGIPEGSICIGSFQKDGDGWGEGLNPKLIKGPDIFCEVIIELNKKFPVFVLLTGPARGYVKKRLSESNIKFKHYYLKNYLEIPLYYKAIDYYLISSRAEGGPKALMESFASGVPVVSTDIGMVHDYGVSEVNTLISKVDDAKSLENNLEWLILDKNLRDKLIQNGLEIVKNFDWKIIAKQYYEKIYSKYF